MMRRIMGAIAVVSVLLGSAGCGAAKDAIKTESEKPDTWAQRSIWTEKKGDTIFLMVVGRGTNLSLDATMARDNAEQDARERAAMYLDATTTAFRERLRMISSARGKSGDGKTTAKGEATEKDLAGGRTIADAAVRGLEFVTSTSDRDSDTMIVLGKLDIAALRATLAQTTALAAEERARIDANSEEVRRAMDEALEQAKGAGKK